MEIRTLRAFVEVVRQGGFSQAAKVIYATQPTISKAVKQLEDELGMPLLDRIGHRSTMTAAGEIVYRRALTILAERDDLISELDELRGMKRGLLRLGMPRIGASTLFAPLFAHYRRRYPGIDVRLIEHGSKRLEELLLAGDIDLGASLLPVPDGFEAQALMREPLVALLPAGHALAGLASVTLTQLAAEPFILFESGFALNQVIADACQRRGFEPMITARSGQIDFIIELVASGLGIGFLPRMIGDQRAHAGVVRLLLDEPMTDWHMAMVWRRGGYLSHAARAWLEIARDLHPPERDDSGIQIAANR